MIQAYVRLKLMTGMARGDMLRLTMSDIGEDGHGTRLRYYGSVTMEWPTAVAR
jgi:hypothetical protein